MRRSDEFRVARGSVLVSATPTGRTGPGEVSAMAATIYVEVESGVFIGPVHRHEGYHAGDFGSRQGQDDCD